MKALSWLGKIGWGALSICIALENMRFLPKSITPTIGMVSFAMFLGLLASYTIWLFRGASAGQIEVGNGVLVVQRGGSRSHYPLSKVRSAWAIEATVGGVRRAAVEIDIGGDVLTALCPDRAHAEAVVEQLGFGPKGKRVHIPLAVPSRRLVNVALGFAAWILSLVLTVILLIPAIGGSSMVVDGIAYFGMGPGAVLVYELLKWLTRPLEVTVGTDGVKLLSGSRQRFVARRDVVAVSHNVAVSAGPLPLVLRLRDGATIPVNGMGVDPERRTAVGKLLEERLFGASNAPDKTFVFDRNERPLSSWRDDVAKAVDENAGYREAQATLDDAQAVLESPLATTEQRVGAALALRGKGGMERVRIAAEGTVDPHVRGALEAVIDEDDAGVEKALKSARR